MIELNSFINQVIGLSLQWKDDNESMNFLKSYTDVNDSPIIKIVDDRFCVKLLITSDISLSCNKYFLSFPLKYSVVFKVTLAEY